MLSLKGSLTLRPSGSNRGPGRPSGSNRGPGRPSGSNRGPGPPAAPATTGAFLPSQPGAEPCRALRWGLCFPPSATATVIFIVLGRRALLLCSPHFQQLVSYTSISCILQPCVLTLSLQLNDPLGKNHGLSVRLDFSQGPSGRRK